MPRAAGLGIAMMLLSAVYQDPEPGVPAPLAEERAARISNLRYELHVDVPESPKDPVTGRVTIRFTLSDASKPLAIDFAGRSASLSLADGSSVKVANEHLVVPASALSPGANALTLDFESADAPLNRTGDFLYALFVPARARQAFPVFDQPDLKAQYSLTLTVPAAWEAVSNGAQLSRDVASGRATIRFADTKPISSYLFTFAAGRFEVEQATRNGRTFRMLHRETDTAKVTRNRDGIFDLHAAAIEWLERYTGIPYPFGKFDFLLVPSFQFGGMEHPGAIYYNASGLLLDESATQNQYLGRASLIAHETSHMWFGDLVTMRWFNDVWMKEVFANFMAAKIVNPAFPEIDHELRFLYAHYPAAYDVDRTAGTNPIRQRLDNLNEAGSLYGAIIYQKAPIVMRQLEMVLGETPFRDGLREYLKNYSFGNATWTDLIGLLDGRTPEDLAAWSHAWVDEAGRPTITTELEDGAITQKDPDSERGLLWSQPLAVRVGYTGDAVVTKLQLKERRVSVPQLAPGSASPQYVLPNADGVAYGDFVLDDRSRRYFLDHLPDMGPDLLRGVVTVTLWEEMLDGRIAPREVVDALMRSLPRERNEQTLQRMLSYTESAYWHWITPAERDALAPSLEKLLRTGLDSAKTASLKSAWFNALRDVAVTRSTLQWLQRVWDGSATVPGLKLAEPDYITLAQELALRGIADSEKVLDQQIARTKNPDRKARMIFVRPALSPHQATRDAFFDALKDAANRRREAWVLEGLGYLHHPLRADTSRKYVGRSLELLRDIQRTGDIFFPKRWMDATLSGHTSPEVARTVRSFLDALPADYPDRLRRVILSSADDLFRVTRVSGVR
jgi:aminopeptidase N